jgi:transcriptional regulator with XRE-family HTH domain
MIETLAQRLKRLVDEAKAADPKMSRKRISVEAKLGETYIGDIIRGRSKNPELSKLAKIAKQLKIALEDLVRPEDMDFVVRDMEMPMDFRESEERYKAFSDSASASAGVLLHAEAALRDGKDARPLDRQKLAVTIAAALRATRMADPKPDDLRVVHAVFRAYDWLASEEAAGRQPPPDAIVNFLRHIL